MTTEQFNAKRADVEDAYNRLADLIIVAACGALSIAALAFAFAYFS